MQGRQGTLMRFMRSVNFMLSLQQTKVHGEKLATSKE
jgi:hypothetical protein